MRLDWCSVGINELLRTYFSEALVLFFRRYSEMFFVRDAVINSVILRSECTP